MDNNDKSREINRPPIKIEVELPTGVAEEFNRQLEEFRKLIPTITVADFAGTLITQSLLFESEAWVD
jgi:hypothetical protein